MVSFVHAASSQIMASLEPLATFDVRSAVALQASVCALETGATGSTERNLR